MDKREEYERDMKSSIARREFILKEINRLFDEYKALEIKEGLMSDNEFMRTGLFSNEFSLNISVTEEEMLKELIKESEGKNIKPDEPNLN